MPYIGDARVEPERIEPCPWAIVAEAPAATEFKLGKALVGPTGRLLWPLVKRYADGLTRDQIHVTNLCKRRLDDDLGDEKLTPEEFAECRAELLAELAVVQPKRVLALGAWAAKALLGECFTTMEACSGGEWVSGGWMVVVPAFHPAAALRPGGEGRLAYTAAAIQRWHSALPYKAVLRTNIIAVDTEGTSDEPLMLTWAWWNGHEYRTGVVYPTDVPVWWAGLLDGPTIIYHNALWDWAVMRAMGVEPTARPYRDTMELAYLQQTEPQGLKALAWKHLGVKMRTFQNVVMPHWEKAVTAEAERRIAADTVTETHTAKGHLRKKPKLIHGSTAKLLRRALKNPELLASRMNHPGPSLKFVPKEEAEAYAIEDALQTLRLYELWA